VASLITSHVCYEENPGIYLEKISENKKKTDTQNVKKSQNQTFKGCVYFTANILVATD